MDSSSIIVLVVGILAVLLVLKLIKGIIRIIIACVVAMAVMVYLGVGVANGAVNRSGGISPVSQEKMVVLADYSVTGVSTVSDGFCIGV